MKIIKSLTKSLMVAALGLAVITGTISLAPRAFASGGNGGGGGGTVQAPNFSGNWSGTISTSFGTGAFTMRISQSQTSLVGSAHFGAPIFDATLKLAAMSLNGSQFSGFVSNGEGSLPITGILSADGTTLIGTVAELGQTFTYVVTRN
jgi:hypothetical protein